MMIKGVVYVLSVVGWQTQIEETLMSWAQNVVGFFPLELQDTPKKPGYAGLLTKKFKFCTSVGSK